MRQTLAADIWKESQLISAALSSLPLGNQPLDQLESYISKVGDYAYYLMRCGAYGRTDEQEWQTLCDLCKNLSGVLDEVTVLKEQVDTGMAAFRSVASAASTNDGVTASLTSVNEEFPEYASLIYDGPYSDHILQRTPKMLENKSVISEDEALRAAADVLQVEEERLSFACESAGQIPCYSYQCDDVFISITKNGGFVLSISRQPQSGTSALTTEQALNQASASLTALGYTDLQHSYFTIYENIITINYHAVQDDVLLYPDLIKVGISLANGEVVHLDASGYLMNHEVRNFHEPTVSKEEAVALPSKQLQVLETHRVVIPTTGYLEVPCWELVCQAENNAHTLLYINCESGEIENLLLLIENENGTLTR